MYQESHFRSLVKSISWRVLATLTTAILVLIFTGELAIAAVVGGLEVIAKMLLYFFHERIWNKIHLGKHEVQPFVLWFTGLPSSGKSAAADNVAKLLCDKGLKVERLDSENVRNIFTDLGFGRDEVNSHIKRVGHLASILEKNGIIVVASFVSPYHTSREFIGELCGNVVTIYMKASEDTCQTRFAQTHAEAIRERNVTYPTELFQTYEPPPSPDLVLDSDELNQEQCAQKIIKILQSRFYR